MTTIDSSPIQLGLDVNSPLSLSSGKPEDVNAKSGFAEVFAGLQPEPPRPAAKPVSDESDPTEPELLVNPVILQRVALSPAMQLIMPSTPTPDLVSLQAFARSQGLDEQAIQLLLGEDQAGVSGLAAAGGSPGSAVQTDASAGPDQVVLAAAGVAYLGLPTLDNSLMGKPAVEPPSPQLTAPGFLPAGLIRAVKPGLAAVTGPQAPAAPGTAREQPVEVISIDLTGADAPADADDKPPALASKGADVLQSGMPRSWLLPGGQPSGQYEGVSLTQGMAVVTRSAEAKAMMAADMVRVDPAATADTATAQEGDGLTPGLLAPTTSVESLRGTDGAGLAGRPSPPQDAAAMPARPPADAVLSGMASKDTAEQLSQRLGEAISQRLMNRLEQGNWQFRFVLNPKSMGEVQVRLHMHAGGLEGSFVTSQASTRELLSEGLHRLRDTLSASGMNVANLDVGARDSSRQGQQPLPTAASQALPCSRGQAAVAQPEPAPVRHRNSLGGGQGWDVLV